MGNNNYTTPLVDADEQAQRKEYELSRDPGYPAWPADFNLARSLETALRIIAEFDQEAIWDDDRDDAAYAMLAIAREALKGGRTND